LDSKRWERIQTLFQEALDCPEGARRAFLEAACGPDEDLLNEVLAMLQEDSQNDTLLDRCLSGFAGELLDPSAEPFSSAGQIGPYKIRRLLGRGGMGAVYLAEREDLASVAAIKFLRDAWMSPSRRERFAIEQRTLAQLDHPSIARLYDANTLADGTPYFIMEYVEGLPLTDYCREHKSSVDERLALLRLVAEAVHHAHQHAVIHRDLKPSNILVRHDGAVKLLDFGIAKQLANLEQPVTQTRTELRLMTPAYAAPEQVRGDAVGVFTDVYALGVILYELLTGRLPFDVSGETAREKEPVRPSVAAARSGSRTDVTPPTRSSWADLDVLCLTAMHNDPQRRYPSVDALIRDIDHYRMGEPLEAQPDSALYRARKFAKRNRRALSAAALALAAVVALVVFFTVRLVAARDQAVAAAARAERIQQFMLNIFEGGDKEAGPSEDLRVTSILERGVEEARTLKAEPAVQAEVYHTLGSLYQKLGHFDRADPLLRSALDIRKTVFGAEDPLVASSLISLGLLRVEQARLSEAEQLVREGLEKTRRASPRGSRKLAAAMGALGNVLQARGAYAEAVPVLEESVRTLSAGPPSAELSEALGDLANTHYYLGHEEACEAFTLRGLAVDRQLFGERHPHVAVDLFNLGNIALDRGRLRQAEQYFRQSLNITRAWYGTDHPKTASSLLMLGQALDTQDRRDEAAALYKQALVIQQRAYGDEHPRIAIVLNYMGALALRRRELDKAETLFQRTAAIFKSAYGEKHEFYAHQLSNLGAVYLERKQYAKAERLLREAVDRLTAAIPEHRLAAIAQTRLGRALAGQRRYREAEPYALAGYKILRNQGSSSVPDLQTAKETLAGIYNATNQLAKAQDLR